MTEMNIYSMQAKSPMVNQISNKQMEFKVGQIFPGKVLFIGTDQNAIIQLKNQKMIAKLEVPIDIDQDYWFQVTSRQGQIQLKVLPKIHNTESLLSFMKLPVNKSMSSFIEKWVQSELPLDKELISLAVQGKSQTKTTEQLISTIKYMVDANIPLNDIAFKVYL